MRLSIRDRGIIGLVLIGALVYAFYTFVLVPVNARLDAVNFEKANVLSQSSDITPLVEEASKLEEERDILQQKVYDVKNKKDGHTTTNEEFLLYLGERTRLNNVSLISFNDMGYSNENGIYKAVFDFELKGSANNINNVLADIDNMGIKYSVGSVSFRQNEAYDYLKRFYDEMTDLPWYKEPTPEELEKLLVEEEEEPIEEETEFIYEDYIPDMPYIPPYEEIPMEEKKKETINDRLDALLKNVSNRGQYKVSLLSNAEYKEQYPVSFLTNTVTYTSENEMRLAVTICFVMFKAPSEESSFLSRSAAG